MVTAWKINEVKELTKEIENSSTVGLVSITSLPSNQVQEMRKNLGDRVKMRVVRSRLIKKALENAKVSQLNEYVKGPTGVIFSTADPFKLKKLLDKTKTNASLKPGAISPRDIIVPKGETPFPPGPIIGELQKAGIQAKIERGKIVVTEDSLVVKNGEKVSANVASILARLDIKPIEIGLNLKAAYNEGILYPSNVLSINEEELMGKFRTASSIAFNLSVNKGIFTKNTIKYLVQKAHMSAMNLAIDRDIVTGKTIPLLISKAARIADDIKRRTQ